MPSTDITQTTQTDMESKVEDFEQTSVTLDNPTEQQENHWDNVDYEKYNGYYLDIGQYGSAIDAYATWVIGKGWTADSRVTAILENITGWGEDTFQQVLWNLIVMKKVQGDSFAEIIRNDSGTLVNLKPLGTLRIVTNKGGKIIRYEQRDGKMVNEFEPNRIFHLCNNRYGDQIHGTPATRRVKWIIDAKQEAMRDWKRISHRATIRVLYVDEDDKTRLADLKKDYAEAINKGEVLILPIKGKEAEFQDLNLPPVEAFLAWMRYLENFFYQELGIPKVALGGTQENTEASAKVGLLAYDPVWLREVSEVEADIWNQLAIRIKINKQSSLSDNIQAQEGKNQAQTGFQPNDTEAGVGKDAL